MTIEDLLSLTLYITPVLLLVLWRMRRSIADTEDNLQTINENKSVGLFEPASLHPSINTSLCIGCTSCVSACPEGDVLGIVDTKAALINPTQCIGHGACATACPMEAITLVFGTQSRGVDIPHVNKNFETNVPGIFIAGELGGMGLIRNAMTQGMQAMESITRKPRASAADQYDVIIIGAGPAGIAATVTAKLHGLRYLTIEQESLGGTVAHYPRGKIVMTQPVELPGYGKIELRETTKENLIALWENIVKETQIKISYHTRLEQVNADDDGFLITTSSGVSRTRNLLLAIGRRGTPRALDVPGEELQKVVYRLIDPEQYRGRHVLVVGGGDSAVEAATSVASEPGTIVTLSYRNNAFNRAKEKNRQRLAQLQAAGRIDVLLNSTVTRISEQQVILSQRDKEIVLSNDDVIVSAGGVLPIPMLKAMGVRVDTKFGTV